MDLSSLRRLLHPCRHSDGFRHLLPWNRSHRWPISFQLGPIRVVPTLFAERE